MEKSNKSTVAGVSCRILRQTSFRDPFTSKAFNGKETIARNETLSLHLETTFNVQTLHITLDKENPSKDGFF